MKRNALKRKVVHRGHVGTFRRNTTDSGKNRKKTGTKFKCDLGMSGGGFRQTVVRSCFWSTTPLVTRGGAFYNPFQHRIGHRGNVLRGPR